MFFKRLMLATLSLALLPAAGWAADPKLESGSAEMENYQPTNLISSNPAAPVTRGDMEALIKEVLISKPEIVIEAAKRLHERRMSQTQEEIKESLVKHKDKLFNDTRSPAIGADKAAADVTIVEFFDYHCGYCKRMLPVVSKLVENDKKVRVVFREFPILSDDSTYASKAALAVHNIAPDKYFTFHTALMNHSGKYDEKTIMEMAGKLGIDARKLEKEMANPAIADHLDSTRAITSDLGIRGTPAMLVGEQLLPGAVPYEDLVKVVETVRSGSNPNIKYKATPDKGGAQ